MCPRPKGCLLKGSTVINCTRGDHHRSGQASTDAGSALGLEGRLQVFCGALFSRSSESLFAGLQQLIFFLTPSLFVPERRGARVNRALNESAATNMNTAASTGQQHRCGGKAMGAWKTHSCKHGSRSAWWCINRPYRSGCGPC